MTVKLEILNPLELGDWDKLLLTHTNYSFFHSSAWARVLSESYKYKPLYFTTIENDKLSALIPVMEVNSFLTGRRGVSLPFTDYCEPIVPDKSCFQEITNSLIGYGKEAGWKYIEWRGGDSYFGNTTPSTFYYGHILDLNENEDELQNRFRDSTKRNIKKATKEGVDVKISNSFESLKAFYRLNCITRKHHGLPPQPFLFFKKVFEHVISRNLGHIALASRSEKIIAGAVYFHFGNKAIYKYGASDKDYQHLRPNNLVMWKAIKYYAQTGFKGFSFGRTEPGNEGLLQFKRGWGTREETINYYKYDLEKDTFIADQLIPKMSYKIFKKTPSPLLKLIGRLLYKHVG